MAALTSTYLAITAIAAAAGGAAYQGYAANDAAGDAKKAADQSKADAESQRLDMAAKEKKANDISTANAMRDLARQRQQSIIGGSLGRGSTILTGGLGVTQPASMASKSLLGQ